LLKLTEAASAKLKLMVTYHVYAESMRDPAQHAIGEVFHEHAEHERAAMEAYLKRAAALGGSIHLPDVEMPPASSDPVGILKIIVRAEQEAIALQGELKTMVGDANPLSFQIEQFMIEDQHHCDEARQMLPQETTPAPVLGVGGEESAAAGVPAEMGAPSLPPEPGPSEEAPPPSPAAAAPPPAPKPASKPEPKPEPKDVKTAALRFRAGLMKLALMPQGMPEAGTSTDPGAAPTPDQQNATMPQPSMAAPGPQPPMATPPGARQYEGTNYLEAESVARQAQAANESQFYRQQADQAQASAADTANQLTQIQGQLDQLQSQVDESQNQVMAAQQEAVTANDQMLNQATLAARMRMGMQQLRAQMMEIASQDPEQLAAAAGGPTPMDVGNQAAQAAGGPAAMGGGAPGGDPAAAGVDPNAVDPMTGQPAADPSQAGTPEAAPGAQAQEGSTPSGAGGGESKSSPEPKEKSDDKGGETTVSIKKGSAPVLRMKVAATLGEEFVSKLPYMAAGALAGGVGAVRQGSDKRVQSLREQVDALKGQQDGGFAKSLELAKAHMSLADAESAKQHPYRAALKGGLAGAGLGAAVGTAVPAIMSQGQKLRGNLQTFQGLA
jgi:hypothetical protein